MENTKKVKITTDEWLKLQKRRKRKMEQFQIHNRKISLFKNVLKEEREKWNNFKYITEKYLCLKIF
jgi:hypothetical protein